MTKINEEPVSITHVLATDLDGTLIPLPTSVENRRALGTITDSLNAKRFELIFCTGRHFKSVLDAIPEYSLPKPSWIICDVGTSIYKNEHGNFFEFDAYQNHLSQLTVKSSRKEIENLLAGLEGLSLQQADHQGPFKISYECTSDLTDKLVGQVNRLLQDFQVPYEASGSIDPFLNCGLIDLLPSRVSKAYALKWLEDYAGYVSENVIYAGDSGNDTPALTSGCKAILVANASSGLLEKIRDTLRSQNNLHSLFAATETATSGVLQGLKHFGWVN